ncbi:hypothetical protein GGS24DRAFT_203750 [Hypoxylon argillaceum]|nr:hypothetical protein GGS24DRAFT_203750 [Hypoxylon argillaceum]
MAIKLNSTSAFTPGEASLVQDSSSSTRTCMNTQPDSIKPSPTNGSITPPLPAIKMRAFSHQASPDSSPVIKKRPSTPNLGDGLLIAFSRDDVLPQSTMYTESEVSTTLTSSNLNQLAKTAHPDGGLVSVGTPSTCSDEDVILIGTSRWSINSKSASCLSSQSSSPRSDETPPTTLTGDDPMFSSDGEIALDLASSILADNAEHQSPTIVPSLKGEDRFHGSRTIVHSPAHKLSGPCKSTPVCGSVGSLPDGDTIPSAESLHSIVRSFLTAETNAKSPSPSTTLFQQHPTHHLTGPDKAKPFWDPQRIFEFYISGAITPEKAKEAAKRNGLPGVIPVIDGAEALKKKHPCLHVSDVITKAANEGDLGVFSQPTEIAPATPERKERGTIRDNLMLKLNTYSAKDGPSGSAKPLHIFVDMSNIHIGFCNSWKISQNISIDRRVRAPAFNFKVLASIMERNRPTKKKVLASSVPSHVVSRTQWPQHFVDAEKQGYKTSILSRVQKVSPIKVGRRRKTTAQGSGVIHPANIVTSGDESAEDLGRARYGTRNGEQGVDEILHLNMMNSILDDMHEPSSMILATGDAAQAEFSEGFLEYATRALSQGWNLELVTWKATISSAWTNPVFRNKHGERFRIIYLDSFLGELNADLCPSLA